MSETVFANVDLHGVKGIEQVHHSGPSTIGLDTIIASQGQIPDVFLRGARVPDRIIEYARSLILKPVDFCSCFISYSSRDEDFARRLHADLQQCGVRVWFAPEDMKIGAKILDAVDRHIRVYDKLLLILSRHSVRSEWIEREVTIALEEERKRKTTVLFPIRLDESVMKSMEPWAAQVRARNIGDFREWKDYDSYANALDRLARDLKLGGDTGLAESTAPKKKKSDKQVKQV